DAHRQRAGEPFVAVRARVGELHAGGATGLDGIGLPYRLVETHASAVERIPSIVGSQLVDLAVDGELRATDAVGVAADDGAEMGVVVEVTGKGVVTQHDVIAPTVPIAHVDRRD